MTVNLASQGVPGVYVQIIPPNPLLNGVPTDIIGTVGTATWGPVNSPFYGSSQEIFAKFGNPQTTTYDMGTQVYTASQQGANNFVCVRVTDGTDVAATVNLLDTAAATGATITSLYTGTLGNTINLTLGTGSGSTSGAPTYKVTIYMTNGVPETYNDIGGSGATFWTNLVNAINLGQSPARGPSQLVVATVGSSSVAPAQNSYVLSGGTNGNSGVTDSTLIGSDTATPRTGMYALRKTGASLVMLADQTNATYWTNQISYGLSEYSYMVAPLAAGYQDNISGAITVKQTAGVNSYAFKLMQGDWCQINDPYNNVTRYVNPQGFMCGILAVTLPSGSSLNKILSGITATQKTAENRVYSISDYSQLQTGGIDVISKPIPATVSAFGGELGINTSSNVLTNGDNYTRMNNFLAATFIAGLGAFIGQPQTPEVQLEAKNTLQTFLQNLQFLGMIGNSDPTKPAFRVILDSTNNPQNRVALGFMQADIQVTLFSIILQFIVNLQAGQSVTIQTLPVQPI